MTSEGEGHLRELVPLIAFYSVLSVESLRSTNFFVPSLRQPQIRNAAATRTYRSSAKVDGRAIREVPVSRMMPVLSSSAV